MKKTIIRFITTFLAALTVFTAAVPSACITAFASEEDIDFESLTNEELEALVNLAAISSNYKSVCYITKAYWSGNTAKWNVEGQASMYQVKLYRDGNCIYTKSVTNKSKSMNLSSKINKDGDYYFSVRSKDYYGWNEWIDSEEVWKKKSSGSSGSQGTGAIGVIVPGGPGSLSPKGQWMQAPDGRWWYQYSNMTNPRSKWEWIDGNNDGISECYYFGPDGFMLQNAITPDGYIVNGDGAWEVNGIVQTR